MASYNAYIRILGTEKEAFSAKLQGIEFFSEYSGAVAEMGSGFAWEVKERDNWRAAGWGEDEIDNLARPVYDHNVAHQNSIASREAALKTIESEWGKKKLGYIRQYNYSEKYAKMVRKTCLRWSLEQARELVTELVLQHLERSTRHITLSRLTINWANITEPGITLPSGKLVDKKRLERLKVTITEP